MEAINNCDDINMVGVVGDIVVRSFQLDEKRTGVAVETFRIIFVNKGGDFVKRKVGLNLVRKTFRLNIFL